jgi:hypothetical protein
MAAIWTVWILLEWRSEGPNGRVLLHGKVGNDFCIPQLRRESFPLDFIISAARLLLCLRCVVEFSLDTPNYVGCSAL